MRDPLAPLARWIAAGTFAVLLISACAKRPAPGVAVVQAIDAYLVEGDGHRIGREDIGRRLRLTNVDEVSELELELKGVEALSRYGHTHVVLQLAERSALDGKSGLNICSPRGDGSTWLIPLAGRWMPSGELNRHAGGATLACASGALAKCLEWGFAPWIDADRYTACTRMARADYCGDGSAHTRPGIRISFDRLDDSRVEAADRAGYRFEALWARDGAHCVIATRVADLFTMDDLIRQCPERAARSAVCLRSSNFGGVLPMFANFVAETSK